MYLVLTYAQGATRGECITVAQGTRLTLGRSSQASRKIRDSHLSRVHLEVDFRGQRALVRDLDSRNGTFVNGQRVKEQPLAEKDRLLAGEQVWNVWYIKDLAELTDEDEETISFLDQPKDCACCGRSISLATFADGEVPEKDGRYLCPDCSVVVNFDTREFEGFEVTERLGAGSAGLVFKARQIVLDRIVALKVLRRGKLARAPRPASCARRRRSRVSTTRGS